MYHFSNRSSERLETCDQRIQILLRNLIREYDCSIICGHRGPLDQDNAYRTGNSKVQWPNSKHNDSPSKAVDIIPYPTMWDDINQFYLMAGHIQSIATRLDYEIRWGGDWDRDGELTDQTFMDLGHFEILGEPL